MKVSIIGTGYVGLVSGVCLSVKGHDVTCIDLKKEVVESINRGESPIYEKGLKSLLESVVQKGVFRARLPEDDVMNGSELILIAVGTPSVEGIIDLYQIEQAAKLIGSYLKRSNKYCSVIVKSTVIPGTTDTLVRRVLEESSGLSLGEFGLGMNPEFLREGEAVGDFLNSDRIVMGFEDDRSRGRLDVLYKSWNCDKLYVNSRTAEMIKYANNCLLATQISAVNELANLSAAIGGIDAYEVMKGVHLDRRWNPILADQTRIQPGILTYLWPGCGFGGSCFPKDIQAIRTLGADLGLPMSVLDAVMKINTNQPLQVTHFLKRALGELEGKKIAVLGLAFKPGTDDIREAPSIPIINELIRHACVITASDPVACKNIGELFLARKLIKR